MKTIWRSLLATLLVVPGVYADYSERKKDIEARLDRTRTLEIPATVLGIIRATEATSQVEAIEAAMEVIALRRPTTLPMVVSTIANAEPQLSIAAASAAASVSPAQADLIHRAAVIAAPAAADGITAAIEAQHHKPKHADERGRPANPGENGQGRRADPDKVFEHPRETGTLPNGKPFPDPPRRPVDPPRPIHYNKPPKPDRPDKPEHPLPERPGNPNPGGKPVRPAPPGGHPVWDR